MKRTSRAWGHPLFAALVACSACSSADADATSSMDVSGGEVASGSREGNGDGGTGGDASSTSTGPSTSTSTGDSAGGASPASSTSGTSSSNGGDAGGEASQGGHGGSAALETGGAGGDSGGHEERAVPQPTSDGTSPYAVECRGDTADCSDAALQCLGVGISESMAGYACSNRCESAEDCSPAPSGTDAEVDCVPLTNASHCLLVCHYEGDDFECPSGMQCYTYPGSFVGYCLYL